MCTHLCVCVHVLCYVLSNGAGLMLGTCSCFLTYTWVPLGTSGYLGVSNTVQCPA